MKNMKNTLMMSLGVECETPFDDASYIFELMPGGCRCLAYISGGDVALSDSRGDAMLPRFPELARMGTQAARPCVLDGHIVVCGEALPDFYACANRMRNVGEESIRIGAEKFPALFIAQDILHYNGGDVTGHPLAARKNLLRRNVAENEAVSIARHENGKGKLLYAHANDMGLPGVVAKRAEGLYYTGTLSPDWVGFRTRLEDAYIICGYIRMGQSSALLVLGKYDPAGVIVYGGLVTLRSNPRVLAEINGLRSFHDAPFSMVVPQDIVAISWVEPSLVCSVRFTSRNERGMIQEPVFNGLRQDISPDEARVRTAGKNACAIPGAAWVREPELEHFPVRPPAAEQ